MWGSPIISAGRWLSLRRPATKSWIAADRADRTRYADGTDRARNKALDGDASARMVAEVRASALRATSASLDQLAASLPEPIVLISLRAWPANFPDDIGVQRRPPYESMADSIMYCQVLSECAHVRG